MQFTGLNEKCIWKHFGLIRRVCSTAVTGCSDEKTWRFRYGKSTKDAFHNILKHIYLINRFPTPSPNPSPTSTPIAAPLPSPIQYTALISDSR